MYLTLSDINTEEFTPRQFPYEIKDIIKFAIPLDKRVWDSGDKIWYIHNTYLPLADKLIHRHTARDMLTSLNWERAWSELFLRIGAPPEVVDAVANILLQKTELDAVKTRIETARRICKEW